MEINKRHNTKRRRLRRSQKIATNIRVKKKRIKLREFLNQGREGKMFFRGITVVLKDGLGDPRPP